MAGKASKYVAQPQADDRCEEAPDRGESVLEHHRRDQCARGQEQTRDGSEQAGADHQREYDRDQVDDAHQSAGDVVVDRESDRVADRVVGYDGGESVIRIGQEWVEEEPEPPGGEHRERHKRHPARGPGFTDRGLDGRPEWPQRQSKEQEYEARRPGSGGIACVEREPDIPLADLLYPEPDGDHRQGQQTPILDPCRPQTVGPNGEEGRAECEAGFRGITHCFDTMSGATEREASFVEGESPHHGALHINLTLHKNRRLHKNSKMLEKRSTIRF